MPELASTVFTGESGLVIMDQHVIIQTVLSSECRVANQTNKWLDSYKYKKVTQK